ncbi:MAG: hypothetical protein JEZ00_06285 [Anaerolineaceae bacterium]|nr:hypothetical protein [Anaerolineaceae bacterium]
MPELQKTSFRDQIRNFFRWTRDSYHIMSAFIAIIALIIVVWWPLVEEYISYFDPRYPMWMQIDWLLIAIFLVMSMLIMAGTDLRTDLWIVFVGLCGGLAIEGWGTQTHIWTYYTLERPPLWIIPAWPIASLSIDRLVRFFRVLDRGISLKAYKVLYWILFSGLYALMIPFVLPTIDKSLTILALLSCALIILSPTDYKFAVQTFIAGSALGYFLEVWGTTRQCWTYYTLETPPLFAVLAHGLAAVAFWRVSLIIKKLWQRRSCMLVPVEELTTPAD